MTQYYVYTDIDMYMYACPLCEAIVSSMTDEMVLRILSERLAWKENPSELLQHPGFDEIFTEKELKEAKSKMHEDDQHLVEKKTYEQDLAVLAETVMQQKKKPKSSKPGVTKGLPMPLDATQITEKHAMSWAPAGSKIVKDPPNNRWLATFTPCGLRISRSWPCRGEKLSLALVLEKLWEWAKINGISMQPPAWIEEEIAASRS